jgi:hypothetical protein
MIKNFISPLQTWLLSQGRCVGCGMPLKQGSKVTTKAGEVVTCKCKRAYVFDPVEHSYRRALMNEIA